MQKGTEFTNKFDIYLPLWIWVWRERAHKKKPGYVELAL